MDGVSRRHALWIGSTAALSFAGSRPTWALTALPPIAVYRNPGCPCCEKWAQHLRRAGFSVSLEDDPNLKSRRSALGIPEELAGCHTALVGDYIIEGHVPPKDILTLLADKPNARGLAVPDMPQGSPGMETADAVDQYDVLLFTADGKSEIYARY